MSNSTSSIQLIGGALSLSPSSGASGLAATGLTGASSSDAFQSLWVGLTQPVSTDAPIMGMQRQALVNTAQLNGSELPPAMSSVELSSDVIKEIEAVLQQENLSSEEALEKALQLLSDAIKNALAKSDVNEGLNLANAALLNNPSTAGSLNYNNEFNQLMDASQTGSQPELTEEQLLAYLQQMKSQTNQQIAELSSDETVDETTQLRASVENLLIAYLEEKTLASGGSGEGLKDSVLTLQQASIEKEEAEQRLRQLWAELDIASKMKEAELSEARLSENPTSSSLVSQVTSNSVDSVNSLPLTEDEVKGQSYDDSLYRETLERLNTEQSRAVVTDPQAAQVVAASERPVAPVVQGKDASTLAAEKSSERAAEVRTAYMPSATSTTSTNDPMTAERVTSDTLQENTRRVVADALNQATMQRTAAEEVAKESSRRQESAALTAAVADAQKMPQSPASPAQSPIAQANNAQDALMQKMLNPAWSRALGERAVMMAQQGPRVAEVRLDPPELGSLRIRVQVHGNDQVSLTINSPNASVREVLEQSLPRLREMFSDQGMNLADASVSDHSSQEHSEQAHAREGSRGGEGSTREDFGELPASRTELRKVGIIDYYA